MFVQLIRKRIYLPFTSISPIFFNRCSVFHLFSFLVLCICYVLTSSVSCAQCFVMFCLRSVSCAQMLPISLDIPFFIAFLAFSQA